MKHWQETQLVYEHITQVRAAGQRVALATVVEIDGSAYRRPGAKFLIEESGETLGGVSGGCLEADVRQLGLGMMGGGEPTLKRYETGSDEDVVWGLGLGCDGTVDVFIQSVTDQQLGVCERVAELLMGDQPVAVSTVVAGPGIGSSLVLRDGEPAFGTTGDETLDRAITDRATTLLAAGSSSLDRLDDVTVFTEVLEPPPWLLVFGAGDDARPLATLAGAVGFRLAVIDHRSGYLTDDRFPHAARLADIRPGDPLDTIPIGQDSFAVVMTHSLNYDREWVHQLLATPVPYIGVLGPRRRTQELIDELHAESDKIYGPVGLDIGADGPEQVALSIVSEVLSVRACRLPQHLRDRERAIHAI